MPAKYLERLQRLVGGAHPNHDFKNGRKREHKHHDEETRGRRVKV